MRVAIFALGLITTTQASSALAGVPYRGEPLRMVSGYPVVVTFLNGRGPFHMMIDTGAVRCAVRPVVAFQAGLLPIRTVLLATMVGEKIVSTARASVRVGLREAPGTEVLINDLPSLDGLESHVDGLIGQNFLSLAPYLVDYGARRLWLGDGAIQKHSGSGSRGGSSSCRDGRSYPLQLIRKPGPCVSSSIAESMIWCSAVALDAERSWTSTPHGL